MSKWFPKGTINCCSYYVTIWLHLSWNGQPKITWRSLLRASYLEFSKAFDYNFSWCSVESTTILKNNSKQFNRFVPNAPFLYPLNTFENLTIFWCFQGVEKRYNKLSFKRRRIVDIENKSQVANKSSAEWPYECLIFSMTLLKTLNNTIQKVSNTPTRQFSSSHILA